MVLDGCLAVCCLWDARVRQRRAEHQWPALFVLNIKLGECFIRQVGDKQTIGLMKVCAAGSGRCGATRGAIARRCPACTRTSPPSNACCLRRVQSTLSPPPRCAARVTCKAV